MASDRIRNAAPRKGLRVRVPCPPLPKPLPCKGFSFCPDCLAANGLQLDGTDEQHKTCFDSRDSRLFELIEAWPVLPEEIKTSIEALVRSASSWALARMD
jgi:hypothetical protein